MYFELARQFLSVFIGFVCGFRHDMFALCFQHPPPHTSTCEYIVHSSLTCCIHLYVNKYYMHVWPCVCVLFLFSVFSNIADENDKCSQFGWPIRPHAKAIRPNTVPFHPRQQNQRHTQTRRTRSTIWPHRSTARRSRRTSGWAWPCARRRTAAKWVSRENPSNAI